MTEGPIRIVDAQGVHPANLDQAVLEQQLWAQGRFMPPNDMIFVFGSNEAGIHGAGAAKFAVDHKHAVLGVSFGPQGRAFAIPTKDSTIRFTLPLSDIKAYVVNFLKYARETPELQFQVTCLGCGLAGLKHEQVAPMFYRAPGNCYFDTLWMDYLPDTAKFWGTF